jgi:hypothetical protein
MSTRETIFWDTRPCLELPYDYRWYGHRLHASLLLEIFRSESRDEILLREEGCNTPGVYIPLDNEYGFKHVISGDKTDAKILNIFAYRDFNIASVPFVASSTSFLFIRALPKFSWYSKHCCSKNWCVRWLFKIHRSREYEFGSPNHLDDFYSEQNK